MSMAGNSAKGGAIAAISAAGTARVVANFALQHLQAASLLRDHAARVEAAHAGEEFGPFFGEMRSYVSACIMSSAASLEGLINEFFIAPNCGLRSKFADFDREFWGKVERWPILTKYQHALELLGLPLLDETGEWYGDAEAVIEFRNMLVHYKPTWDPRTRRENLAATLHGKYQLSPFPDQSADFITLRSMSADCSRWVVRSVVRFMREFDGRANLDPDKMIGFWRVGI